jgi:hypothetical protein
MTMDSDDTKTMNPVVIIGQGEYAKWMDDEGNWHYGTPPQEESK